MSHYNQKHIRLHITSQTMQMMRRGILLLFFFFFLFASLSQELG